MSNGIFNRAIFNNAIFNTAAVEETRGMQVVLFPSELRLKTKCDKALYALAIIANDCAPRTAWGERLPSFSPPRARVRLTGLEYQFA